ncbi:hypothetical protein WJX73_000843 [Symbiochloris irregularis]|uniref:Uncharacterized protein n=1 Tax=Symbiochloris irregularis TaxID=706552 RepID=A0AAW1PQ39_9CHLO
MAAGQKTLDWVSDLEVEQCEDSLQLILGYHSNALDLEQDHTGIQLWAEGLVTGKYRSPREVPPALAYFITQPLGTAPPPRTQAEGMGMAVHNTQYPSSENRPHRPSGRMEKDRIPSPDILAHATSHHYSQQHQEPQEQNFNDNAAQDRELNGAMQRQQGRSLHVQASDAPRSIAGTQSSFPEHWSYQAAPSGIQIVRLRSNYPIMAGGQLRYLKAGDRFAVGT